MTVLMARGPARMGRTCALRALHGSEPPGADAPRSRLRARRQRRISSWCPDSSTSGHAPATVLGGARVVRVLGIAAERSAERLLGRRLRMAERAGQLAEHGVAHHH